MSNGFVSTSNHHGKAKTAQPWTTAEEITLYTTRCNAMDKYSTRNSVKRGFCLEVFANFEKEMGGLFKDTIPLSPNGNNLFIGDEYLTDGYLTEKEQQQLLLDEEALRETLEEETRAEKSGRRELSKNKLMMSYSVVTGGGGGLRGGDGEWHSGGDGEWRWVVVVKAVF
nr:hypothetical protein [Tanacetum cinerariifolium]